MVVFKFDPSQKGLRKNFEYEEVIFARRRVEHSLYRMFKLILYNKSSENY
jgi:hypothetical protein